MLLHPSAVMWALCSFFPTLEFKRLIPLRGCFPNYCFIKAHKCAETCCLINTGHSVLDQNNDIMWPCHFLPFCINVRNIHVLRKSWVFLGLDLECTHSGCRNSFWAWCHLPDAGSSVGVWLGSLMIPSAIWSETWGLIQNCVSCPSWRKKGASVSVPLWLICQTLLQRSLSHVTQLRRICRDCGEFSALISRRLPNSLKEQRRKQTPPRLPPYYLSPSYYRSFHDSSLHLLSLIVKIFQPDLFPASAPPLLFSSLSLNNRSERKHQDVLGDERVTYSDSVWCLSVQEVSKKKKHTHSARQTADLSFQWHSSGIFCLVVCF